MTNIIILILLKTGFLVKNKKAKSINIFGIGIVFNLHFGLQEFENSDYSTYKPKLYLL